MVRGKAGLCTNTFPLWTGALNALGKASRLESAHLPAPCAGYWEPTQMAFSFTVPMSSEFSKTISLAPLVLFPPV